MLSNANFLHLSLLTYPSSEPLTDPLPAVINSLTGAWSRKSSHMPTSWVIDFVNYNYNYSLTPLIVWLQRCRVFQQAQSPCPTMCVSEPLHQKMSFLLDSCLNALLAHTKIPQGGECKSSDLPPGLPIAGHNAWHRKKNRLLWENGFFSSLNGSYHSKHSTCKDTSLWSYTAIATCPKMWLLCNSGGDISDPSVTALWIKRVYSQNKKNYVIL